MVTIAISRYAVINIVGTYQMRKYLKHGDLMYRMDTNEFVCYQEDMSDDHMKKLRFIAAGRHFFKLTPFVPDVLKFLNNAKNGNQVRLGAPKDGDLVVAGSNALSVVVGIASRWNKNFDWWRVVYRDETGERTYFMTQHEPVSVETSVYDFEHFKSYINRHEHQIKSSTWNHELFPGDTVQYIGRQECYSEMKGVVSSKGEFLLDNRYCVEVAWNGHRGLKSAISRSDLILVAKKSKPAVRRSEGDYGSFGFHGASLNDYLPKRK